MPDITTLLIACPLVFLAGFVDAIGGGGGLISLPGYLFAGLPPTMAVATNKLSSTLGTAVSAYKYAKSGCVNWSLALSGVVAAIIGSVLGARIGMLLPENTFKIIMLVLLPVLGAYVILRKELKPSDKPPLPRAQAIALMSASSFVVGLYDGIYGPGAGVFYILAYTGLVRLDVLTAGGNTKLVNLASNVGALTTFLISGRCNIAVGLIAAVFSIVGHWLGATLAIKNGGKIVRTVIIVVLCVLAVKVITDMIA